MLQVNNYKTVFFFQYFIEKLDRYSLKQQAVEYPFKFFDKKRLYSLKIINL